MPELPLSFKDLSKNTDKIYQKVSISKKHGTSLYELKPFYKKIANI